MATIQRGPVGLLSVTTLTTLCLAWTSGLHGGVPPGDPGPGRTGKQVYEAACAACHGHDGRGAPPSQLGLEVPVPDFTDCNFASREPDADWVAVGHEGGPVRGFHHAMPALGGALTRAEIQAAVDHIRTFCGDPEWPRGELNMPRPMFTEKAYPEDEAVWTVTSAVEGPPSFENEIIYERRFGKRSQWELVVPFGAYEREGDGGWTGGVGDIALGVKHDVFHSTASGTIVSLTGEVILPLGDEDDGMGSGVTIFEPFVSFGQLLPWAAFVQLQAGAELPADTDIKGNEAFWRGALGRTFVAGEFGRAWSPMVEVLGARDLESGATTHWDLVPQFQVTLNTRQHVMGNVAVRVPLNDTDTRDPQLLVYVLWDWFDGGFFEGW